MVTTGIWDWQEGRMQGIPLSKNWASPNPANTDQTPHAMDVEVCNTFVVFFYVLKMTSFDHKIILIFHNFRTSSISFTAENKALFYNKKTSFS